MSTSSRRPRRLTWTSPCGPRWTLNTRPVRAGWSGLHPGLAWRSESCASPIGEVEGRMGDPVGSTTSSTVRRRAGPRPVRRARQHRGDVATAAARAADRFRVVRIDLRGHGGSPVPAGPYRVADLAEDVRALLDDLDVPRVRGAVCRSAGWSACSWPRSCRTGSAGSCCAARRRTSWTPVWHDRIAAVRSVARPRSPAPSSSVGSPRTTRRPTRRWSTRPGRWSPAPRTTATSAAATRSSRGTTGPAGGNHRADAGRRRRGRPATPVDPHARTIAAGVCRGAAGGCRCRARGHH